MLPQYERLGNLAHFVNMISSGLEQYRGALRLSSDLETFFLQGKPAVSHAATATAWVTDQKDVSVLDLGSGNILQFRQR